MFNIRVPTCLPYYLYRNILVGRQVCSYIFDTAYRFFWKLVVFLLTNLSKNENHLASKCSSDFGRVLNTVLGAEILGYCYNMFILRLSRKDILF